MSQVGGAVYTMLVTPDSASIHRTSLSAREVRERLGTEKGYAAADLPSERTMRDILNRMGYRLDGPRLERVPQPDMLSDATPPGSLQVPASGCPILLMSDRQTTGGYPKIATVITADLPVAGQLAPGDWIEFEVCGRAGALDALRRREAALLGRPA